MTLFCDLLLVLLVRAVQLLLLQHEARANHNCSSTREISVTKQQKLQLVLPIIVWIRETKKREGFFCERNEKVKETYLRNCGRSECHELASCLRVRYNSKVDTVLGSHLIVPMRRHISGFSKLRNSVQPLK